MAFPGFFNPCGSSFTGGFSKPTRPPSRMTLLTSTKSKQIRWSGRRRRSAARRPWDRWCWCYGLLTDIGTKMGELHGSPREGRPHRFCQLSGQVAQRTGVWPPLAVSDGGDQVPQRGHALYVNGPAAGEGDVLVDGAGRSQEVVGLVEGAAEAMSRIEVLEPAHRSIASFYAPVILLDHVVFILTGAVINVRAEFLGDGPGIAGVAVGGDLLGLDLGDRLGGAEECLGRGEVARLAQGDVDQGAVAVDRPEEIAPLPGDFDVGLVDVPAPAGFADAPLAQALGEQRRQLPVAHRLVGEHEAPDQEHFRKIPQAQLVTQPPEDHEEHDVGRDLNPVQHRATPLVVSPPALPAPEAPEAMNRSPFLLGGR